MTGPVTTSSTTPSSPATSSRPGPPAAPRTRPEVVPDPTVETITVVPWPDAVIDELGHDPRSPYVERFWLGILGPSSVWLLRRVAAELDRAPDGFALPLQDTARALGIAGQGGRHSPFVRTLNRCCQFGMAQLQGDELAVRRKLPPLTRRQLERLPEDLQADHQRWLERAPARPRVADQQQRARHLALSLLELGEDVEATEAQLHRWRFHPAVAHDAMTWARARLDGGPDDAA